MRLARLSSGHNRGSFCTFCVDLHMFVSHEETHLHAMNNLYTQDIPAAGKQPPTILVISYYYNCTKCMLLWQLRRAEARLLTTRNATYSKAKAMWSSCNFVHSIPSIDPTYLVKLSVPGLRKVEPEVLLQSAKGLARPIFSLRDEEGVFSSASKYDEEATVARTLHSTLIGEQRIQCTHQFLRCTRWVRWKKFLVAVTVIVLASTPARMTIDGKRQGQPKVAISALHEVMPKGFAGHSWMSLTIEHKTPKGPYEHGNYMASLLKPLFWVAVVVVVVAMVLPVVTMMLSWYTCFEVH